MFYHHRMECACCDSTHLSATCRRVIRREDSVFHTLFDFCIELTSKYVCKPCYRLLQRVKINHKRVADLTRKNDDIKERLRQTLQTLVHQKRTTSSPAKEVRSMEGRLQGACRSLQFPQVSKESPGVIVSIIISMS